ncbi:MAG TPA: phospholipase D family protein [Bacillota bacterium]|nr:phospholipase D family protein [Bacillota bacterium]
MLSPEARHIYLNELKPPPGYILDRALATTFSLDLLTLLFAPLAMVFYECQEKDFDLGGRVEVIEALRRVAGRLVIFCQKGRITVPRTATLLYSYLEPVVVEVQPGGEGVFHPKTWLLRFTAEDGPVVYRFLCLSRNLTFDHSWDTVLSLEGVLQERRVGFSANRPLRDFIRALPKLADRELPPQIREHIELLAEEAGRVIFEAPPGFDREFDFVPSGIPGYRYPRLLGESCSRLAIISPFISPGWLMQLPPARKESFLVTREESVDSLSDQQYGQLSGKFSLHTMHEAAQVPEMETEDEQPESQETNDLPGLHAKLYVTEDGANVVVATGSANATDAAFRGRNVEFMVRLRGKRERCGIDRLFGSDAKRPFPGELFRPYERPGEIPEELAIKRELNIILEGARRDLLKSKLALQVQPEKEGLYSLILSAASWPDINSVNGFCYPITLKKEDHARELKGLGREGITFTGLPPASVTGFIAFQLKVRHRGQDGALAFVLNLPVDGMPEERDREILLSLIDGREKFIRYLLYILSEEQDVYHLRDAFETGKSRGRGGAQLGFNLPLLEELVRAYSRQPAKIERIARLVAELEQTEKGKELLPEDFRQLWAVIEAAGKEAACHER